MYPSCETRWFFTRPPEGLIAWFASRDMKFGGPASAVRVDHYLPLANEKEPGIKLREGNIEVKQLIKELGEWHFPEIGAGGKVEQWVKWSFRLDESDGLSRQIIHEGRYGWLAIEKERLGYTYHFKEGGVHEAPLHEWASEGCQVELTRIGVRGKTFYTFGLEAFSASGQMENNLRRGAETAFSVLRQWCVSRGLPVRGLGFREGLSISYPAFLRWLQV